MDSISRLDAINKLNDGLDKIRMVNNTYSEMIRRDERIICVQEIRALPSAEPTEQERTYMSLADCVSRQAAIDSIGKCTDIYVNNLPTMIDKAEAYKALNELPSAEPERKTGKWIIQDNPGTGWFRVMCSECGEDVTSEIPVIGFFPNCKALWDYCPYCGSYNGGEQSETD